MVCSVQTSGWLLHRKGSRFRPVHVWVLSAICWFKASLVKKTETETERWNEAWKTWKQRFPAFPASNSAPSNSRAVHGESRWAKARCLGYSNVTRKSKEYRFQNKAGIEIFEILRQVHDFIIFHHNHMSYMSSTFDPFHPIPSTSIQFPTHDLTCAAKVTILNILNCPKQSWQLGSFHDQVLMVTHPFMMARCSNPTQIAEDYKFPLWNGLETNHKAVRRFAKWKFLKRCVNIM